MSDKEPSNMQIPRIEIYPVVLYKCLSFKEDGFCDLVAPASTLWRCDIIGVNGLRETGDDDNGCIEKRHALMLAQEWQDRTGWPICDLGRQTQHDESLGG